MFRPPAATIIQELRRSHSPRSSAPDRLCAGAINASLGYESGLLVAVCDLGSGRFIVNTLRIRENLGKNPAAERLLRNMLRYAARDVDKSPADLPVDFDVQLKKIGYRP